MSQQDPRHPKSSYDAKYPHNKVTVTETGHELHWDDTPDKERFRMSHRTGTYWEIANTGRLTEMVTQNKISYVKGGITETADKNYDRKVGGSDRTNVQGGSHTEIKGTSSTAVNGNSKITVGGDMVSSVKGEMVTGVVGTVTGKFGGGMNVKVDGKMDIKSDKASNIQFAKDVEIMSKTKITLKVGESEIVLTKDKIIIHSEAVVISKRTHIGMPSKGTEIFQKVDITDGIPAARAYTSAG